ncbi:MAG: RagB/SusD family nutrient uptake outer membrane protein, partial [Bacteroidaceae bacterium]|nr:RagB/SusD family nutrient uptake outer membrane protein [Bacteroidaceae bacterium]
GSYMYMAYGKVNVGYTYFLPENASGVFGRSLRLSEAYLNYMEACAMIGGNRTDDAIAALNDLREKRFDPEDFEELEFDNNDELLEFIKDERRRELCFEGHRWFDLRRWGMPSITHTWHNDASSSSTYRLQEGDLQYTLPIPDEAMEMNGSLIQNELAGKRYPENTTNE